MNNVTLNTTKSEKVIREFQNRKVKLKRIRKMFSGTWKTSAEIFFSLLCPAREADWIPDWTVEVLHSDTGGYISGNCIFRTMKPNPDGDGLWVITTFKENEYLEGIQFKDDVVINIRLEVKDNKDDTVTGTWDIMASSLSEKGNKEVRKIEKQIKIESRLLPKMVNHYLVTGKMISKLSLIANVVKNKIISD